ncbi:MAG: hypothetical protein KJT03_06930 [Verrucomicrobiae bacterium]|nr:hypothetical protein [Verrucomicrobiae bacterium]
MGRLKSILGISWILALFVFQGCGDKDPVIQVTFLQINDVYEIEPASA